MKRVVELEGKNSHFHHVEPALQDRLNPKKTGFGNALARNTIPEDKKTSTRASQRHPCRDGEKAPKKNSALT